MGLAEELQEFIRRLRVAEDESRTMRRDLVALRQGMRDVWTERGGGGMCVTTLSGIVTGGRVEDALPGSSIRIVGRETGTDYGTYFLPTGEYEIDLILAKSDVSFSLYAIGPAGVRFNGSVSDPSVQYLQHTQCVPNTFQPIICKPAPGYIYLSVLVAGSIATCAYPVKQDTMGWEDSQGYSGTAEWIGGQSWQESAIITRPTLDFDYGVFGGSVHCDATDAIDSRFTWDLGTFFIEHDYKVPVVGGRCPDPTGIMSSGARSWGYSGSSLSSKTCPDESTKFSATYTIPVRGPFYAVGDWLRIFEQ